MLVSIDAWVEARLRTHARAARPAEACGLLARRPAAADPIQLVRYVPMENVAEASDRFRMDPIAIVRTDAALRASGLQLGGVFHSHPHAPPIPSAADRVSAWPGLVHLILGSDGELTAWHLRDGALLATTLVARS